MMTENIARNMFDEMFLRRNNASSATKKLIHLITCMCAWIGGKERERKIVYEKMVKMENCFDVFFPFRTGFSGQIIPSYRVECELLDYFLHTCGVRRLRVWGKFLSNQY